MNIAYLHYHLKPGGVTTVIRQQVQALSKEHDTLVICGQRPEMDFPSPVAVVPGVGYDTESGTDYDARETADQILETLEKRRPRGCDLLHIHNPLLAKNNRFLEILERLKNSGLSLLLQIHDFAEDGRPGVYYGQDYPSDCHYAVLNSRDFDIFRHAGLKTGGVHLLPNMIDPPAEKSDAFPKRDFILYPVRAIRRKNLGEALLLAQYFPGDGHLAVTLPPNSPQDMESYRDWRAFVTQQNLSAEFEASSRMPYPHLTRMAYGMISTSITEGFGFSFLEPWTVGKMLWGRGLGDICRDFKSNGITLDHLYDSLKVPLSWFDARAFSDKWTRCLKHNFSRYGLTITEAETEMYLKKITTGDGVDFGLLDEDFQRQVLSDVIGAPNKKETLKALNPCLDHFAKERPMQLIETNRKSVISSYGRSAYARRLTDIYKRVLGGPVRQSLDRRYLSRVFLAPERFSLLKWSPYGH